MTTGKCYNAAGARLDKDGNIYQVKDGTQGAIVKKIFGCNNLNGSPKGHVKVHVFKTQHIDKTSITSKYAKYRTLFEQPENTTLAAYLQQLIDATITSAAQHIHL